MNEPLDANPAAEDIRKLVAGARAKLKEAEVSFLLSQAITRVFRDAERAPDYDQFMRRVDEGLEEVHVATNLLEELRARMAGIEDRRVRTERLGDVWWKRRQREIEDAFTRGPTQGRQVWLRTFAELLGAWRLDLCTALVSRHWLFPPNDGDILNRFRVGTQALRSDRSDRRAEALPMLEYLANADGGKTEAAATDRAAVLTVVGRIHLYVIADAVSAIRSFEAAIEAAPKAGLPRAALGAAYQKTQDQQAARKRFMEAINLAPDEPDGYIGMAMLCEDLGSWPRAREWYDRAVEAVSGMAVFDKLLAPVSGRLYWRLAHHHREKEDLPAAAEALDRAIQLGIRGKGDYPERRAYAELAEIYSRLRDRADEAGEAFYQAARRYGWRNEEKRAVELLHRSLKHRPDNPFVLWHLAESLRVASYRPDPPYIDEEGREQVVASLQAWTRAAELRLPDPEWAWVYVSRGLINDQREKLQVDWLQLRSEAAVYLERALLLDPHVVEAWAALGRQHCLLGNLQTADDALTKALKIDPSHAGALEGLAATLAQLGESDRAQDVLDQRLDIADDPWTRSVKSYVLMTSGRAGPALDEIGRAIEVEPSIPRHRAQRARCHEYLDQDSQARRDYEWLVENADLCTPLLWPPTMMGRAHYGLGRPDESIRLYEQALADGTLESTSIHGDLGLAFLAQGDLARGEDELRLEIAQARNEHDLDVIEFDVGRLVRPGAPGAAGDVAAVVTTVRPLIADRRLQLGSQPASAAQELAAALASPEAPIDGHPQSMALTAALARTLLEVEDWSGAAIHYRALLDTEQFPEGRLGLARALEGTCQKLDESMRAGPASGVLAGYQGLIEVAGDALDDTEVLLGLRVRAAICAFELELFDIARTHLRQAPQTDKQEPIGDVIARVARALISKPERYWALDERLGTLGEQMPDDDPICADVAAARRSAGVLFDEYYCNLARTDRETGLLGLVVPVILELGADVEPRDRRGELDALVEQMRQQICADTGITVPAIQVMVSGQLDGPAYTVKLNEVVIDRGEVQPGMSYVEGAIAGPAGDEPTLDVRNQQCPWSGRPGRWVDGPVAMDGAERSAVDTAAFVGRHLETVLRRNLPNFLSLDDVSFWVEEWASKATPQMAARVTGEPAARVLLTRLLRALTREFVPIRDADAILRALTEAWPATVELRALMREIRLRLRENLPGQDRPRLPAPSWLLDALAPYLRGAAETASRVISRGDALDLLDRVDGWLRGDGIELADVVLVTPTADTRLVVARLLSTRFPMIAVLSEEELLERNEGVVDPEGAVVGAAAEGADH